MLRGVLPEDSRSLVGVATVSIRPVEFLTDEYADAYGRFAEEPTRPELERFFYFDEDRTLSVEWRCDPQPRTTVSRLAPTAGRIVLNADAQTPKPLGASENTTTKPLKSRESAHANDFAGALPPGHTASSAPRNPSSF